MVSRSLLPRKLLGQTDFPLQLLAWRGAACHQQTGPGWMKFKAKLHQAHANNNIKQQFKIKIYPSIGIPKLPIPTNGDVLITGHVREELPADKKFTQGGTEYHEKSISVLN